MKHVSRRSLRGFLTLAAVTVGGFWMASAQLEAALAQIYPPKGTIQICNVDLTSSKDIIIEDFGTFHTQGIGPETALRAVVGQEYISPAGLRTLPLQITQIGGDAFAEGLGRTRFWLDTSRPVGSALWEQQPGTYFPAIQEMRFHFLYQLEAQPGRVLRSVNPARMRSSNVNAFPPPPGTTYSLMQPVDLEDTQNPGVIVGRILTNSVYVPGPLG
jgi:hypothetical protein